MAAAKITEAQRATAEAERAAAAFGASPTPT